MYRIYAKRTTDIKCTECATFKKKKSQRNIKGSRKTRDSCIFYHIWMWMVYCFDMYRDAIVFTINQKDAGFFRFPLPFVESWLKGAWIYFMAHYETLKCCVEATFYTVADFRLNVKHQKYHRHRVGSNVFDSMCMLSIDVCFSHNWYLHRLQYYSNTNLACIP